MMHALWNRLKNVPLGKWIFMRLIALRIPYTGTMRAQVLKLEPGDTEVLLRDRRIVRNHLDCIHAIALANLGEFTGGIAVLGRLPEKTKFIITTLKIDYLKKARGDLRGRCQVGPIENFSGEKKLTVVTEILNRENEI